MTFTLASDQYSTDAKHISQPRYENVKHYCEQLKPHQSDANRSEESS